LENALNRLRILPKGKGAAHLPRAHVILLSNSEALVAFSDVGNSSPWTMGIPRLKFPSDAPSRSTLKLEEAFHVFIPESQAARLLRPDMTAVDLGACPGGWTYQFVRRKIRTMAVDNGSIAPSLMQSGLVTHLTEDAFKFRPQGPVDWLVCDVVEQPSRISDLIAMWFVRGYCKFSIFNLKLPMKKRFEEVYNCLDHLRKTCAQEGLTLHVKAKQLYHDRKEVTVFAHLSLKS
jgi:23S rRNA (cytidine2498-2'-O)-methyltransferase